MAKRGAGSELTDRNWDQEDEPEEAGKFKVADADVLATRKFKTARRRKLSGGEGGDTKSPFKAFAGFTGLSKPSNSGAPTFSFGNAGNAGAPSFNFGSASSSNGKTSTENKTTTAAPTFNFGTKPSSNGNASENKAAPVASSSGAPTFSFGFKSSSNVESSSENKTTSGTDETKSEQDKPLFSFGSTASSQNLNLAAKTSSSESTSTDSPSKVNKAKYFSKLKALNESVAKWIKEHVDKNPLCVLSPIFKDYENHLAEIEKFNPDTAKDQETKESSLKSDVKAPAFPGFSFSSASATGSSTPSSTVNKDSTSPAAKSTPITTAGASLTTSSSTDAAKPFASGFSFGSSTTTTTSAFGTGATSSGFSFKPLNSTDTAQKPVTTSEGGEEEEYVPPKAEVKIITEEGAVYTKRCKLFYQLNKEWKEKGVGNLHIKPGENKTQLIVRADNNLGTILLNILLSKGIPTSRQGKNNVMMMCVPNPPIKGIEENTGTPMLIRVKTGEDADELLSKLDENKV